MPYKFDGVTLKQIDYMKHCIGYEKDKVKRNKYSVWRNYFTTSETDEDWDGLVRLGLAINEPFTNGIGDNPQVYYVSKEGLKLLERLLEIKIVESI